MDLMDPDHPDWIVIPAASPKTRSGPKPIPVALSNQASSLTQPLKRGGKTVPPFERPNPYPVQLESKQPPTLSSSRSVCVSPARDSHLRVSAAKLSAPRRPSAPQQTRTQKFASDLTLRWLALINSIGCLSQVWVDSRLLLILINIAFDYWTSSRNPQYSSTSELCSAFLLFSVNFH